MLGIGDNKPVESVFGETTMRREANRGDDDCELEMKRWQMKNPR